MRKGRPSEDKQAVAAPVVTINDQYVPVWCSTLGAWTTGRSCSAEADREEERNESDCRAVL